CSSSTRTTAGETGAVPIMQLLGADCSQISFSPQVQTQLFTGIPRNCQAVCTVRRQQLFTTNSANNTSLPLNRNSMILIKIASHPPSRSYFCPKKRNISFAYLGR